MPNVELVASGRYQHWKSTLEVTASGADHLREVLVTVVSLGDAARGTTITPGEYYR
jgi:hypothetical protein